MSVMLSCGCAANAVSNGQPSCAIHDCHTPVGAPDLTGRMASCYSRCPVVPSDPGLAFFSFRGEGSPFAVERCKTCGILEGAHHPINRFTGRAGITDHPFIPRGPHETDSYYCGCRGWD